MLRVLLIFFLLSSCLIVKSQSEWPHVGSYWNYQGDNISHSGYGIHAESTTYILRDTTINGSIQKIYREVGHEKINVFSPTGNVDRTWDNELCCLYVRNDTFFRSNQNGEDMLLRFNYKVGDSIGSFSPYWGVDSFSHEFTGDDTLRRTNFTMNCFMGPLNGYVVDSVGPLGIENVQDGDGICYFGGGTSYEWHFFCFSGAGIIYPWYCYPLVTGIDKEKIPEFSMYYFEIERHLILQLRRNEYGNLIITDVLGKSYVNHQVRSISTEVEVDLAFLPNGIYLASFSNENGKRNTIKFVVN